MFIFIFFNISVFQILYIQYRISNMLSQIRNLGLKFNFSFNQIRTSTSLNTIDKLNIYHYGKKTKKNIQLKNITDICSKEKMNNNLSNQDPVLDQLIKDEYQRQCQSIELIASENYTSLGVIECLGSILTNKYSEGRPGRRYYGGNKIIDQIENLCAERALTLYGLDKDEWAVNVQPYSGSPANFAVYTALLKPHDRIMGLDLPSGGHLTHGFYTHKKKISATSIFFESLPYHIGSDERIDYDELERQATLFRPKMIICGASAYPRDMDYGRFREIADKVGALLMCDMAHISGLVATKEISDPFPHCDIVTTTTHKTLRGPRSGMIFVRKEGGKDKLIHDTVFPGLQGGPHNHQIAGVAHQLYSANQPEFKQYIQQVKANASTLAQALQELGYHVCTGGTDNHLVLISLRNQGITGSKMEKVCEESNISLNKNAVYGDKNPMSPSGIRLGTSAVTTRGMTERDILTVALFLDRAAKIAVNIQAEYGKKLVNFNKGLRENQEIEQLKNEVIEFISQFEYYNPIVGSNGSNSSNSSNTNLRTEPSLSFPS